MELKELLKFIKLESVRLKKLYGSGYKDRRTQALARTVKLTEEIGELCNEILINVALQRKEKLEKGNADDLPEEFADVIITTLLLAETTGVDVEKALERKIENINRRYS